MRVAIIVPVYGVRAGGGAAVQARGFALEAVRRGWAAEIWTTCAGSHYDWHNEQPAGSCIEEGVTVRRFPITQSPQPHHIEIEQTLTVGGTLQPGDQYRWLDAGAHSAPLYAYVASHAVEQDVVITLPYASPITHYASWAAPEKVILWPCLHDEPYAYLEPTRLLFEHVCGVMFNSPEEESLARERLGIRPRRSAVLGEGVVPLASAPPRPLQPAALLYVGRLEAGKNLPLLYGYVHRFATEESPIKLLVAGQGPVTPPDHPAFRYLGYVAAAEKAQLLSSVLALCQPSLNESFSLTIMESWLAQRPVLVHGACEVTRGHVHRSQGGLWFHSYEEFAGAVIWLQTHAKLAQRMGERGQAYVQRHYTWPVVAERFSALLAQWQEQPVG